VPPEEPTSEDEAIEDATAAATAYYAIRTEIEVEHPADSSAIDTVAIEAAAEKVHASARKLEESGRTYGSPVEMNPNRRGNLELAVLYHPAEKARLVQDAPAAEEVVPC
jgi:ribosomal protein S7